MVMHKVDANMEAGGPPSQEIIRDMGALVQGSLKDRVFVDGAGLHPSAKRVRVTRSGGKTRVLKGPYAGENELVASFIMLREKSLDHAVAFAERLTERLSEASGGDVEVEVGPVVEPWDLGMMEKPAHEVPQRFLLLSKADAEFERGAAQPAGRAELVRELHDTDRLLAEATLTPSSTGSRRAPGKGQQTWLDGPFTESKELIAGYSILNVPSKRDALAWAERYAAILTENEIDVRELVET
jgi:hypothetical protein